MSDGNAHFGKTMWTSLYKIYQVAKGPTIYHKGGEQWVFFYEAV